MYFIIGIFCAIAFIFSLIFVRPLRRYIKKESQKSHSIVSDPISFGFIMSLVSLLFIVAWPFCIIASIFAGIFYYITITD